MQGQMRRDKQQWNGGNRVQGASLLNLSPKSCNKLNTAETNFMILGLKPRAERQHLVNGSLVLAV